MPRIALGLSYDGARWQGWQTQPHGQTVQDTLEAALAQFVGAPLTTVCAGRTDAGVHAALQVVHLDAPVTRRPEAWLRGVNRYLPASIALRWAREVPHAFHARFSAHARTYVYLLHNAPSRSPFWAGRAAWCFRPLDVAAMQAASQCLLGTHDFSSFRSAQCQATHPVRTLSRIDWQQHGALIRVTFEANAFLQHMVRNLMGALVYVGLHRLAAPELARLLAARDRTLAPPTYAPEGLYLAAIRYPDFAAQLGALDGSGWLSGE